MRTFVITFDNKNDMDVTLNNLFEVFKGSNDLKTGKIVMCKTTEDGINKIYLHVSDKAAGSYAIVIANAFDAPMSFNFITTKSECKDIPIKLPVNSSVTTFYEEEKK